ncbi:AsnC family transcriptional regulator [Pseudoduganella lurida]|uniref:AsnC family transcriptional regulator n=1 Tax=Pseudoduganella lurida TaxID=1036180 RepID=A0A562REB2_9BURK|nr:Lrp/AsnC family transcriptional regulator [Pseudoduganella lurida]TWI67409.1 AsnC family transcriptional regulator [Pseudoduganella lurida]
MTQKDIDRIDRKIMDLLQQDARITNQALADRVALSPSACLRRVRDLEERGFITGYRAQIAVDRMRNVLIVMAQVSFERHTLNDFCAFDDCVAAMPEIVESCRVSGLYDYMLRAVVDDMQEWKRLMLVLLDGGFGVEKIVSHFLMDEMKSFCGYQLMPTAETAARKAPRAGEPAAAHVPRTQTAGAR